MKEFNNYIETKIDSLDNQMTIQNLFAWIEENFPELEKRFAWNQPMFTINGSFVIGFSVASKHFSVAVEGHTLNTIREQLDELGYDHSIKLFKIKWDQEINYDFLKSLISHKIEEKRDYDGFWFK